MNAQPHTHALVLRRRWTHDNTGCYVVVYGDTNVNVYRGPFLQRRITRGGRRAVRKHDVGSLAAERQAQRLRDTQSRLSGLLVDVEPGEWASSR